jgi:hypothetical protein
MCFRSAEAQQGERSRVLNSGIIILLIPPLLMLGGIIWFAWRRSRQQAAGKGVRSGNAEAEMAFATDKADHRRREAVPEA